MCILNFSLQRGFAHDTFTIRPDTGLPIETLLINFIPLRKESSSENDARASLYNNVIQVFLETSRLTNTNQTTCKH